VRLFLDTSVVLAACGSDAGASRAVCEASAANNWVLVVTPYVCDEVTRNLDKLPATATDVWAVLLPRLVVMPDIWTVDRPAVFGPAKDRPILFSALAWADVLLTLDHHDFGGLLDQTFYGLPVIKPGRFLQSHRER
jgi:hypothetical protein